MWLTYIQMLLCTRKARHSLALGSTDYDGTLRKTQAGAAVLNLPSTLKVAEHRPVYICYKKKTAYKRIEAQLNYWFSYWKMCA